MDDSPGMLNLSANHRDIFRPGLASTQIHQLLFADEVLERRIMAKEPLAIPLKEAAFLLGVKDTKTMIKYARERRIRIVGTGNGQKVVVASIHEYLNGESEWQRARNPPSQFVENLAPARYDTSQGTKPFQPRWKRKRSSTS
jgi:hypothetical protein